MKIAMTSSHGYTFLALGTVVIILQMLQCTHAEEGWTSWIYDAINCKWLRSRSAGGTLGCPEGEVFAQAMDCNCSTENWNDWMPISLDPCEEARSRGQIITSLPQCPQTGLITDSATPVFDCYETRPCVNFTDIPCVDSPTVQAIASVCASKANMSIPAFERIRDIGEWGNLCGEEMLAIECFQNFTQCTASESHGFLINASHCFYAEICDAGSLKPAIQMEINNDAVFNQNWIDAIDFTPCLALANSDPNPTIQEQLAIAALSCMLNLIENAELTGSNSELALLMAQVLLNCAARLEDLGSTNEFYDFTSRRCSMRLYGDPHVETCNDTSRQTTCAAPGRQTYLDIFFMYITGVNTQQWSPSLVTVLTEVTIEFKSLLPPHAVTVRYKASNGDLPGVFEHQAVSILDIDFVLIVPLSANRVLLIWPHTGVIIIISNWWSSIYQFTMRASQSVMETGTGILIEGCPPGEVLYGRRRRRDTVGISKRDADLAFNTTCDAANLTAGSPEMEACLIDITATGNDTIAGAFVMSIADATSAETQDASMIQQAGVWSNNVVEIVDGEWTAWSNWTRTRSCTNPSPSNGGAECVGNDTEIAVSEICSIDGGWSDWGPWVCDVTCGNGTAVRRRNCTNPTPQNGGADCAGDETETRACSEGACPVDGEWSDWGLWVCDVTCGNGTAVRHRNCTNPPPQYGGSDCVENETETRACSEGPCPVDGEWSDWGPWICDVTCGNGTAVRRRNCTNPPPMYGGSDCVGDDTETQACSEEECPVDGGWSDWGPWVCDVTCGNGTAVRHRNCTNPPPQYGGSYCVGNETETRVCYEEACPVHGGWADWGPWDCSVTCGLGTAERTRTCTNPLPANGGDDCVGPNFETTWCYPATCPDPVDGGWSDWGPWICDVSCGFGTATRFRTCSNPSPSGGGAYCTGPSTDTQWCYPAFCPVWEGAGR